MRLESFVREDGCLALTVIGKHEIPVAGAVLKKEVKEEGTTVWIGDFWANSKLDRNAAVYLMKRLEETLRSSKAMDVRVLVAPDNSRLVQLYYRYGFEPAGILLKRDLKQEEDNE